RRAGRRARQGARDRVVACPHARVCARVLSVLLQVAISHHRAAGSLHVHRSWTCPALAGRGAIGHRRTYTCCPQKGVALMNGHQVIVHLSSAHPTTGSAIQSFVLLYVGPDQILPLTSALGAVIGVLLIVWHRVVAAVRKGWQWLRTRRANSS